MIKFKQLVHKPTGTIIKYDDWLRMLKQNNPITWTGDIKGSYWSYEPKEMLFSDEFEVVYDC